METEFDLSGLTKRQKEVAKYLIENRGVRPMLRLDLFEKYVIIYPSYETTTEKVAKKVKEALNLKEMPGYSVFPRMGVGGYAYTFEEYN